MFWPPPVSCTHVPFEFILKPNISLFRLGWLLSVLLHPTKLIVCLVVVLCYMPNYQCYMPMYRQLPNIKWDSRHGNAFACVSPLCYTWAGGQACVNLNGWADFNFTRINPNHSEIAIWRAIWNAIFAPVPETMVRTRSLQMLHGIRNAQKEKHRPSNKRAFTYTHHIPSNSQGIFRIWSTCPHMCPIILTYIHIYWQPDPTLSDNAQLWTNIPPSIMHTEIRTYPDSK